MSTYINHISKNTQRQLKTKLEHELIAGRRYRESGLSLQTLAVLLGTNRHYVSTIIATCYGCSFCTLLNKLRVNDAKRLMASATGSKLSIEEVASVVGFANRQSFHRAFTKQEDITPLQFKKNITKNNG